MQNDSRFENVKKVDWKVNTSVFDQSACRYSLNSYLANFITEKRGYKEYHFWSDIKIVLLLITNIAGMFVVFYPGKVKEIWDIILYGLSIYFVFAVAFFTLSAYLEINGFVLQTESKIFEVDKSKKGSSDKDDGNVSKRKESKLRLKTWFKNYSPEFTIVLEQLSSPTIQSITKEIQVDEYISWSGNVKTDKLDALIKDMVDTLETSNDKKSN